MTTTIIIILIYIVSIIISFVCVYGLRSSGLLPPVEYPAFPEPQITELGNAHEEIRILQVTLLRIYDTLYEKGRITLSDVPVIDADSYRRTINIAKKVMRPKQKKACQQEDPQNIGQNIATSSLSSFRANLIAKN